MHAPTPWKVMGVMVRFPRRLKPVLVDANYKPVDLNDRSNLMLIALAVNAHHKRAERAARKEAR